MIISNSRTAEELPRLPPRSVQGSQQAPDDQPISRQHLFGNFVTAVYSAILRELKVKGADARFRKTERGKFTLA